jgi:hypothetical protein
MSAVHRLLGTFIIILVSDYGALIVDNGHILQAFEIKIHIFLVVSWYSINVRHYYYFTIVKIRVILKVNLTPYCFWCRVLRAILLFLFLLLSQVFFLFSYWYTLNTTPILHIDLLILGIQIEACSYCLIDIRAFIGILTPRYSFFERTFLQRVGLYFTLIIIRRQLFWALL